MSNYIVSARKYRPINFDSVVGQSALTTTLKNSIASGRLAHAYLFCGPRGVGKTTCARIFAKTINCLTPQPNGEACETCESCRAFNEQRSYNIHELDAASNNGVDDIRQLIEQVYIRHKSAATKCSYRRGAHALVRRLQRLPQTSKSHAHAIFILATTEKPKLRPPFCPVARSTTSTACPCRTSSATSSTCRSGECHL
jgi:DNA polymerase-3 subunit gamma/tau